MRMAVFISQSITAQTYITQVLPRVENILPHELHLE